LGILEYLSGFGRKAFMGGFYKTWECSGNLLWSMEDCIK